MSETGLWQTLAGAIQKWVRPIIDADDRGPTAIARLAADATGGNDAATIAAITDAAEAIAAATEFNLAEIETREELRSAAGALLSIIEQLGNIIGAELARRLSEYLTLRFLAQHAPRVYTSLLFIGAITPDAAPGSRLRLDALRHLFAPQDLIRDVYSWGGPAFEGSTLIDRLVDVAASFGAPVSIAALNEETEAAFGPLAGTPPGPVALLPLLTRKSISLGFAAVAIKGTSGEYGGILILPTGMSEFEAGDLSDQWTVTLTSGGGGGEGYGAALRPSGVELLNVAAEVGDGSVPTFAMEIARKPEWPWALDLGSGFGISADSVALDVGYRLEETPTLSVGLAIRGFEIVVAPEGDGFLRNVLPADGLRALSDLSVAWSREGGFRFEGGLGFQTTIPLHQTLGPVTIQSIDLTGLLSPSPILSLAARLNVGATLGPVQLAISGIGVSGLLDLPDGNGPTASNARFGPLAASIDFLWPTGVGLAVSAGAVTGGGFIQRDESSGSYTGILDLKFTDIGLVAIGIITTKFPDGDEDRFALFVSIGVTFSPAVLLPYGWQLVGAGGLCAVHRTTDTEALRSGLRNKRLDSILFPADPILNANKILSDSERVFPVEEGRFVVSPMAKLIWGGKDLITANIAVVFELPAPIVIALLGQVKARVPDKDQAQIKLNLDILGIVEVEKKTLSFDATLYDSKILSYDLSGDSALRLRWGASPQFALSIGGFHPKFTPPASFPSLRRLRLALRSTSSFDLSCKVYHALTSNTLQFGAKLDIHAEACGASLDGDLSFDTIFEFSPFAFEVDINGGVSARYKGRNIASVRLSCDLSGPTPWHAKGKAKVSVLAWDVTAKFNKTWGSDTKARTAKIDPLDPFLDELRVVANWGAPILPRRSGVESFKSLNVPKIPSTDDATPATAATPHFLAHPAGGLEFRQRLLPLGIKLEMFRNAEVKNNFKFDVRLELSSLTDEDDTSGPVVEPTNAILTSTELREHFAIGQFKSLSKSDRLSKASFEKLRAGVEVGPGLPRVDGTVEECELEYESILIMPEGQRERVIRAPIGAWSAMRRTLYAPALRRAGMRHRRTGKFATGEPGRVGLVEEGYVVVDKDTLARIAQVQPLDAARITRTEAEDLLEKAVAEQRVTAGSAIVVPEFEEVL